MATKRVGLWTLVAGALAFGQVGGWAQQDAPREIRIGMIGLDTGHAPAFADMLNAANPTSDVAHARVVAAYPKGTPSIQPYLDEIPKNTKHFKENLGVEICDSIEAMIERVDAVMLETVDGRPHLEQALPVLRARKPLFIDKPMAGSLADAIAIAELARHFDTPFFSASSLRYSENAQAIAKGKIGKVLGADCYSPCPIQPDHPDLFWYGVHGVEMLYTVMGAGCESVTRYHTEGADVVVGAWQEGRIGTFRGIRAGQADYGGTAFGEKGVLSTGPYSGYQPLVAEVVRFFRTGVAPIDPNETIELFAFMEAADESKRRGGAKVSIAETLERARVEASKTVQGILDRKQ